MNPPGNWGRPFDLAYSNIPSLQMEVETTILPKFKSSKTFCKFNTF